MNFAEKSAIVTGAAVGIGRAVSHKLALLGANLSLIDVNEKGLAELKKELEKYGVSVLTFVCDVSKEEQVKKAVEETVNSFGSIDILINNAAVWRDMVNFTESSTELWQRYWNINVMGTVYFTRYVIPRMIEKGYGKIVNVASVAGVYGNKGMSHYSATKAALIAFTKSLAKEVSDKGVCVNCVSPGTVSPANVLDMDYSESNSMSYSGRTGTQMENANLICFLASDEAPYISGENVIIDGCRKML